MTEEEFRAAWDGTPEEWEAEYGDADDWVSSSMMGTVLVLGFGVLVGALVAIQVARWAW